jgi:NodT family efflux transporter outer membrane factor (OMF) lipoprotein
VPAIIGILLTACRPFNPAVRSSPTDTLPRTFSLYTGEANTERLWWKSFNDPELDRLVSTALSGNFSLQEAWSRLRQSRAVAVQAAAESYPQLEGAGNALVGREKFTERSSRSTKVEDFSLGLLAAYEVDLWGRLQAQTDAALREAAASREDVNTAAVTIAAEVANRWILIISQRMQKQLLQEQLRINETLLELVDLRFRMAIVSALDVYQQQQVVEGVKAEIPLVERDEMLLRHELAILLGRSPLSDLGITRSQLPQPPALPPTGLPADLLAARPDVRSAGLRLEAADWQIAAARAARLPALSLRARARYGQGDLDVLFSNWLLSLAGNLTLPILDGGRLAAEVDRTRALADENLAAYYRTVLTAVREVEDALVSEAQERKHIEGLEQVAAAARRALEEAGVRYQNGLNDYLPVLTQLLTVQGLERDLIRRQAELLTSRIGLYRALGGTWPRQLSQPDSQTRNIGHRLSDNSPRG